MFRLIQGDALDVLKTLPDCSVQCVVTSPPYWGLRDYGVDGQIGLEPTPAEYLERMVAVFAEVRRVLRDDGTAWVNMGDCYANDGKWGGTTGGKHAAGLHGGAGLGRERVSTGLKPKDLCGIPWRLALALQADGWYLRCDIIWAKPNPMPESVTDRPTKAHEYIFLLSKSERYFYDAEAVKEPVTGGAHARGDGINPKAVAHNNSRKERADDGQKTYPTDQRNGMRIPTGWKTGPGAHTSLVGHHGHRKEDENDRFRLNHWKQDGHGRRNEGFNARYKTKQNESFSGAVSGLVSSRNLRSVWTIPTHPFPEAHFATFPPALAERCIKAGTSEYGACPTCGTPWQRMVDKTRSFESGSGRSGNPAVGKNGPGLQGGGETGDIRRGPVVHSTTAGWESACSCPAADPVSCVVLDPFSGAGTTGLVAQRLGRDFIGIELNPEYVEMARRRIESDAPLLNLLEA